MTKLIICLILLFSGVGTVPVLIYFIWACQQDNKEVEAFRAQKARGFKPRHQ